MISAMQNLAYQGNESASVGTLLTILLIVGIVLIVVGVARLAGAAIRVNAWGAIIGGAILILLALFL